MKKGPIAPTRHRYRLTLEYDGTGFSGWQKQNDARTLQGTLLAAAAKIFTDDRVDIQGHGRTDGGVHALAYTAHLETTGLEMPAATMVQRFNELLPASIVLLEIEPCHPRFHARHSCIGRSYIYQIAKRKTAFHKNYVWWVREELDVTAMAEAATQLKRLDDQLDERYGNQAPSFLQAKGVPIESVMG